MARGLGVRLTSVVLTVAMAVVSTPLPAAPSELGRLEGRTLAPDGRTPLPGVVVHVVSLDGARELAVTRSDPRGVFHLERLPAGSYRVVAETDQGAFLAPEPVVLDSGEHPPLALIVKPGDAPAIPAPAASASGGLPRWGKWVIAGTLIVGALALVDLAGEDEEAGSPF